MGAALSNSRAWDVVADLSDHVGHRMAGSPNAEKGVEWALEWMRKNGFKNVHKEPVPVPHWVRGEASFEVVDPAQTMHGVALGPSVGTPAGGITAEVVEVADLEEMAKIGNRARGKIVLYNKAMPRHPHGEGYGNVVSARHAGAIVAAKAGAVAALIRSVGSGEYRLAHTGAMGYDDSTPKIPFAAISAEDADLLHRLLAGGKPIKVRMKMTCQKLPDVESSNVVGDIPGRELPNEIVLLGAHLDSWDLGTGAIDDGAGVAIMLEAARLIGAMGGARRTVRVVLFMNEEQGVSGGRAYTERHRAEMDKHVAALEADSGGARPLGFSLVGDEPALATLRGITAPLATIKAQAVAASRFAGADITGLQIMGVPCIGVSNDMTNYFDWHHSAADTVDKLDREDLAISVAAVAVVAQGLADAKQTLPRTPAASRQLPPWAR